MYFVSLFFFKQKTADEMRRSDWSSDVCSSDLGKFAVLPMEGVNATDEALYANTEYLSSNQEAVDILVEELLRTAREINANPALVADLRKQYALLPERSDERREGKEGVSPCSSRWPPDNTKTKTKNNTKT